MPDDLTTASAPADGPWTFDGNVAARFDDMFARSIPGYEDMRDVTTSLAVRAMVEGAKRRRPGVGFEGMPRLLDVGCATGGALALVDARMPPGGHWLTGWDAAPEMVHLARQRFSDGARGEVSIEHAPLGAPAPAPGAVDVVLLLMTLQFTHRDERLERVKELVGALADGGILLLGEKVDVRDEASGRLLKASYRDVKLRAGYTPAAIARKDRALQDVLDPLTARQNMMMLYRAGARSVECVWRNRLFAVWMATK